MNFVEIREVKLPDAPTESEIKAALNQEYLSFKKYISGKTTVCMVIEGKQLGSEEFAGMIDNFGLSGKSEIAFVIGSSYGLSEEFKKSADYRLSISKMTFPHQLMRVILLEQLYRAFSIMNGGKYHK